MGHKGAFSHHWRKNTHKDSQNWPLNLPKKKVPFPRGKMSCAYHILPWTALADMITGRPHLHRDLLKYMLHEVTWIL